MYNNQHLMTLNLISCDPRKLGKRCPNPDDKDSNVSEHCKNIGSHEITVTNFSNSDDPKYINVTIEQVIEERQ